MARKWLALLLVLVGGFGLLPYLQTTLAMTSGVVKGHSTDRSRYAVSAITSTNQLVVCTANPIVIRRNDTMTGAMFRCWTNYATSIPIQWELADPSNPLISTVLTPSAVTLASTDTNQCRTAEIRSRHVSQETTGTVVFRGKSTTTTTDFYVEVNFPVTVTVKTSASGVGFTCP